MVDLRVLLLHLVDVIADSLSEGAIVGDASEERWGRVGKSFREGASSNEKVMGDRFRDHVVDVSLKVARRRWVSDHLDVPGLGYRAPFANVLVLLARLLGDVDPLAKPKGLVLGKYSVLCDGFRHDWQGKKSDSVP